MDHLKKPDWLKVKLPSNQACFEVSQLLKRQGLNTICQSARCPNLGRCWEKRTAAFLILGNICTRNCGFCAVEKGQPSPVNEQEPEFLLQAVKAIGLAYVVITSVTRDDLPDGGAGLFARAIHLIKENCPETRVEVLIPDFQGKEDPLRQVLEAGPDVLNHNLETTLNIYPLINRSTTNYYRSLKVLSRAKAYGAVTKSGLMLGLGESSDDLKQALTDLRESGCDLLTMGQYLQPSPLQVPINRFYTPEEFSDWQEFAFGLGFKQVVAGPLVRSSYQAESLYESLRSPH